MPMLELAFDAERAKAAYRNGVPRVTMPRKAGAKPGAKKVPIETKKPAP